MGDPDGTVMPRALRVAAEVDLTLVSVESLLKACYWFSRDFVCEVLKKSDRLVEVVLAPRSEISEQELALARGAFIQSAMDFALREKIEARTSGVRDLLLAKAFSEAGVLEDLPQGPFGDQVEESKPDGMFKILDNPQK